MIQPAEVQPAGTDLGRTSVADFRTRAEAQRALDALRDHDFPMDAASIVGSDLRMVEGLGRPDRGRAAGAGAAAWLGLFVGVLLARFARGDDVTHGVVLECVLLGLVLFGLAAHTAAGDRRDVLSPSTIVASRYEVQVDREVADDARSLLATLAWRSG